MASNELINYNFLENIYSFDKLFLVYYFAITPVLRNLSEVVSSLFADHDHVGAILAECASMVVRVVVVWNFESGKAPLTVEISTEPFQEFQA